MDRDAPRFTRRQILQGTGAAVAAATLGVVGQTAADPEVRAGFEAAKARKKPDSLVDIQPSEKIVHDVYPELFGGREKLLPERAWVGYEGYEGLGRNLARLANIYFNKEALPSESFDAYYLRFLRNMKQASRIADTDWIVYAVSSKISAENTYTLADLKEDVSFQNVQTMGVSLLRHFGLHYQALGELKKPGGKIPQFLSWLQGSPTYTTLKKIPFMNSIIEANTDKFHIYDIIRLQQEATQGMMDYEPSMNAKALLLHGSDEAKAIFKNEYPQVVARYQQVLTTMGIPFKPLLENQFTQKPDKSWVEAKADLEKSSIDYLSKFSSDLDTFMKDPSSLEAIGLTVPPDPWQTNNHTDLWYQMVRHLHELGSSMTHEDEKKSLDDVKGMMQYDYEYDRPRYYMTLMSQQVRNPKFLDFLYKQAQRNNNSDAMQMIGKLQQGVNVYEAQASHVREAYLLTAAEEAKLEYNSQFELLKSATTTRMLSREAGEFDPNSRDSVYWNLCKLVTIREIAQPRTLAREGGFARDVSVDNSYATGRMLFYINEFEKMLMNWGVLKGQASQDISSMMIAVNDSYYQTFDDPQRYGRLSSEQKTLLHEFCKTYLFEIDRLGPSVLRAADIVFTMQ